MERETTRHKKVIGTELNRFALLILILLLCYLGWFLPFGKGIFYDSLIYLSTAQSFVLQGSLLQFDGNYLSFWPPITPLLLSGAFLLTLSTALYLKIIYLGNLVILSVLLYCYFRRHHYPTATAALYSGLLTTSYPVLISHLWVWSEPFFLTFFVAILLTLDTYAKKQRHLPLLLSGLLTGLLILTRYSGLLFVPVLLMYIYFISTGHAVQKIKALFYYSLGMLCVISFWFFNPLLAGQPLTSRGLALHSLGPTVSAGLSRLAVVSGFTIGALIFYMLSCCIFLLVALRLRQNKNLLPARRYQSAVLLFWLAGIYVILLAAVAVLIDHTTSLSYPRLLEPPLLLGYLASFLTIPLSQNFLRGRNISLKTTLNIFGLSTLFLFTIAFSIWAILLEIQTIEGRDRFRIALAEELQRAAPLLDGKKVVSNQPAALYWGTGQRASYLSFNSYEEQGIIDSNTILVWYGDYAYGGDLKEADIRTFYPLLEQAYQGQIISLYSLPSDTPLSP